MFIRHHKTFLAVKIGNWCDWNDTVVPKLELGFDTIPADGGWLCRRTTERASG